MGKSALWAHSKSQKHKDFITHATSSEKMVKYGYLSVDDTLKRRVSIAELTLVYHNVRHHLSYKSMDCGIKTVKGVFKDSAIAPALTLARTKSEAIVKNILGPYFESLTIKTLKEGNYFFSVAVDASNKKNRHMYPIMVRYFCPQDGLQSRVLHFYEDADGTAEGRNLFLGLLESPQLKVE